MIDTKQNRDVILVYCDQCANTYRVLTSIVEDCELTLSDMIEAIGLPRERLCTYCWNGEELYGCNGGGLQEGRKLGG